MTSISALDLLRAMVLRRTLSVPTLRRWYHDRATRLFALFMLSVAIYLPLSLAFPLWVLAIGPMVWGLPHLIASTRFVSHGLVRRGLQSRRSFYRLTGLVFLGTFALRLATERQWLGSPLLNSSYIDLSLIIVAFAVAGFGFRTVSIGRAMVLLSLIGLVSWYCPLEFLGLLILAHNFVAFIYWINVSKSQRERVYAQMALGVFALIHVAIFAGAFDGMYKWVDVPPSLKWAGLDYGELGELILPWTKSYVFWFHAVVSYAFGQSIHYYVWLKAVPEGGSDNHLPLNFRQSYAMLVKDMGSPIVAITGLGILGLLAIWILHSYALARDIYFLAALYHGYFEIGSLPLLIKAAPK